MDYPPSLVNSGLPTPLYHQVYLILRGRIRQGVLAAGQMLPGEQELARMMRVSRITVKRALNELAAEGLVSRHRGRGTVVARAVFSPVVKGSFDTLIESLRLMGLETDVELQDLRQVPAEDAVAAHLELPVGEDIQQVIRLRRLQGEPFSYLVTYLPMNVARRIRTDLLATEPMLTLLEQAGAGAYEAEQWITAVSGAAEAALALNVAADFPLLKIERVMRGADGKPVQLIHAHYRSDRFQYHLKTQRKRGGGAPPWATDA